MGLINKLHPSVFCTECEEDMNTNKSGYIFLAENKDNIAQSLSDTNSDMIDIHQSNEKICSMGSYSIKKTPETLFMMMKPNSKRLIAA